MYECLYELNLDMMTLVFKGYYEVNSSGLKLRHKQTDTPTQELGSVVRTMYICTLVILLIISVWVFETEISETFHCTFLTNAK